VFETAILGQLRNVPSGRILPSPVPADRIEVLQTKLKAIRADISGYEEDLREGRSKRLVALLTDAEKKEEALLNQLQEAKAECEQPLSKAWDGLAGLVDLVAEHGDEARLKIRGILRRVCEEARLVIVRRGSWTLAAVQFFFVGGATQHFLVAHR